MENIPITRPGLISRHEVEIAPTQTVELLREILEELKAIRKGVDNLQIPQEGPWRYIGEENE